MKTFTTAGYLPGSLQLFEGVDEHSIAPLLAECEVLTVPAGQRVEAGTSARLFVVLAGALSAASADAAGGASGDSVRTKYLPGECVGELAVLDDESQPMVTKALEDSEVLVIDAETLWRLIDRSNGVARNMLRLLSFRVRAANAQVRRRQKLGEFYRQLSMVDGLTALQNRAWLNDQLPLLAGNAQATSQPLTLIMLDLDHFKKFNDTWGHPLGDRALQTAAKVLSAALRPTDFAVRYGGEEMMVILPHADLATGVAVAQRLCERMREAVVFDDPAHALPHITASFGVAMLAPEQDAAMLVEAADHALYRAKHAGRDCVAT